MVLVGPSGCGKSTLLRMIAGLEEVTAGSVEIGGRDVTDLAPRHRDIAMVFQSYALYPHMTVRQNLGYGLKVRRTQKAEIAAASRRGRGPAGARAAARQATCAAVGRPAPARRHGSRHRPRAAGLPDGRAAVEPRREAPRRHARVAGPAARPARRDDGVRDARPDGGDDAGPARRRDAGRTRRAGRRAADAVPRARRPVRGGVHRLPGDEPGRRRRSTAITPCSDSTASRSTRLAVRSAGVERVVLGIRPEAFEEASFGAAHLPRIQARVEVVEELGADAHVFFTVDAAPVSPSRYARQRRPKAFWPAEPRCSPPGSTRARPCASERPSASPSTPRASISSTGQRGSLVGAAASRTAARPAIATT